MLEAGRLFLGGFLSSLLVGVAPIILLDPLPSPSQRFAPPSLFETQTAALRESLLLVGVLPSLAKPWFRSRWARVLSHV